MTPEQSRLDEAGRWLSQAHKDLNAARLLASPEPSRSVFHSQQAAEKAAKAFLSFHDVPFRKTHDLTNWAASAQRWIRPLSQGLRKLETRRRVFQRVGALLAPQGQE